MTRLMIRVFKGMVIYPKNMSRNLEITQGAIFSQKVLLELIRKGMSREEAYRVVQKRALKAWDEKRHFKEILLSDKEFLKYMSPEEVEACFDLKYHLQNIDAAFQRLGL
jgi:adenylosuccinate lyase